MTTIFIVDDSAAMVMSLKATLEISGFKVETAWDGEQALAKIQNGLKPDLIITDINMPKMDGITLIGAVLQGLLALRPKVTVLPAGPLLASALACVPVRI
jgi:CheY-like chemotaxis protein